MSGQYYGTRKDMTEGSVLEHLPLNADGSALTDAGGKTYTLAAAVSSLNYEGPSSGQMRGGDYLWQYEADAWNGASVQLQRKNQRGSWVNTEVAAKTAEGSTPLGVQHGTELRVKITGTPTNFYSNIGSV